MYQVELEEEAVSGLLSLINEDAREDLQKGDSTKVSIHINYTSNKLQKYLIRESLYIIYIFMIMKFILLFDHI